MAKTRPDGSPFTPDDLDRAGRGDRERPQDGEVATTAMTRAGGKPKGHKETSFARIVAGNVDPQRATSELEFLRALNAHLPVEAFDELSQTAPEKVADWTRGRHIHCPCVLEAAYSLASLAQTWRDDAAGVIPEDLRSFLRNFGESSRHPVPEIWLKELERLHRLPPVEPIARRAIASERELHQQDLTLHTSAFPALKRLKRLLKKKPAQVIQEVKADARRAQAQALGRVEVAPPLTDGMESVQEYLPFALRYWAAMRARFLATLHQAGIPVHVVRPTPNLARDAHWLVLCQVDNKRPRTIAEECEGKVAVRTVENAIRDFAQRIQLTLRHRRGRPARKPTVR